MVGRLNNYLYEIIKKNFNLLQYYTIMVLDIQYIDFKQSAYYIESQPMEPIDFSILFFV